MKTRYTLEEHLQKNIMDDTTLLDIWRINKKRFEGKLQATVQSFPSYSMHDISHTNNVIDNIECLLGESGINQLSLTDTWLILHAALLHDWGMVLTDSQIQDTIGTRDFRDFIEKSRLSDDQDLSNAIKSIEDIRTEQLMVANAYSIRKNMTLILSEYFRKYHGDNSHKQIIDNISNNYKLSYDLIQSRILEILADIVLCHTRDIRFVLKLPQQQKGQNKDQFHPRFIAMLLRLGDLLDMENNRFNDAIFQTFFDELPEKSMLHLKKHHSLKEFSITEDEIALKFDCPDTSTYRITRQTVDWLKNDLDFFLLNWNIIVPKDYNGRVPVLNKCEVLINGEDVGHLQLSFSKEQIHNMLEGYNLYSEQFVCIREIIQNAIDASKIQIYRDIINEKYGDDIEKLLSSPYELFRNQIFEQYPIYINMSINEVEINKLKICFEICDFGTGINENSLRNISHVCVSYKNRKRDKEEYIKMPKWLRPTGGFGIGIQSVFTMTDLLKMASKAENEEFGKKIEITPMKYGGYISAITDKTKKKRGTDVKFNFEIKREELNYIIWQERLHNEVDELEYIIDRFDYISGNDYYIKCFQKFILNTFANNLLKIYLNDKVIVQQQFMNDVEIFYLEDELIYQYEYPLIRFWDKTNNILVEFKGFCIERGGIEFYFRGVKLKDERHYIDYLNLKIDIYGEDVQNCLTFDRNKLNYLYRKNLGSRYSGLSQKVIQVYINVLERGLKYIHRDDLVYVFMLSKKYNLQFKYENIRESIPIYKVENGAIFKCRIEYKEYVELFGDDFYVIDFSFIQTSEDWGKENDKRIEIMERTIKPLIKEGEFPKETQYIMYIDGLGAYVLDECSILNVYDDWSCKLLKCSLQKNDIKLYKSENLKWFLEHLFCTLDYCASIGLERYSMLEIVVKESFKCLDNYYYQIITPLKRSDFDNICCYTREEFIESVIHRSRFTHIINKVYNNQKKLGHYNCDTIRKGYINLIGELYDYNAGRNPRDLIIYGCYQ